MKIDTAINTIEKNNPMLKGALPNNYFSRLALDKTKLVSLLDTINEIDTLKGKEQDVIGRVYEYFLDQFALKESSGKGKGEFYVTIYHTLESRKRINEQLKKVLNRFARY